MELPCDCGIAGGNSSAIVSEQNERSVTFYTTIARALDWYLLTINNYFSQYIN